MKSFVLKTAIVFIVPTLVAIVMMQPPPATPTHSITLAPMIDMPEFVHEARAEAQHAYQFAANHHDLLTHFPCYCGCVYLGHTNNTDCYVQAITDAGEIVFDQHAAVCGICVEITNDVARLWGAGQEIDQIYATIVATYSQRGPSTEL